MKLITLISFVFISLSTQAETIYQCAVDNVVPRGVRLNIIENQGQVRANLIFGTTVSGTMYNVDAYRLGYKGSIKGSPNFPIEIYISTTRAKNSNIEGFASQVKAVYPTQLNSSGFDQVTVQLVCGKKISDRWN